MLDIACRTVLYSYLFISIRKYQKQLTYKEKKFIYLFAYFVVLGIEPNALYTLSKCSTLKYTSILRKDIYNLQFQRLAVQAPAAILVWLLVRAGR
jgi:hypothetical protein